MSERLFGTDGIRSRFGDPPLDEATVRRIGAAVAAELRRGATGEPLVLLGGDTRSSTPQLVEWIGGGLAGAGARTVDCGVLPTAAIAFLVPERRAAAGVVISASHNPASDNGIKLIGPDGFKWSVAAEAAVEARLGERREPPARGPAPTSDRTARGIYRRHLAAALNGERPLDGLRLALDLAHGAAVSEAELFADLGATVELTNAEPDGARINDNCGATHPEALAATVRRGRFDLGFSFDGDADRAILIDERGTVRDGDAMLYLWARDLLERGELGPPRVVATSMSNLGLERALATIGVGVERCDVGDRAVVETLRSGGLRLGGEQSGHLVDLRRSTTGDGLLTALVLSAVAARAGRPVSELLAGFVRYPQLLVNVRVRRKPPFEMLPEVAAAATEVETALHGDGRLVLRYSGTEPLARIMLEGPDALRLQQHADVLAAAIRGAIGAN